MPSPGVYRASAADRRQLEQLVTDLRESPTAPARLVMRRAGDMQRRVGRIEAASAAIGTFQPVVFPGLLQTEDYARAVFSSGGDLTPDQVEAALTGRMGRAQVLEETSRIVTAVHTEGVLRWPLGSPQIMAAQIEHVIDVSHRPNVQVGVIPWTSPVHVAPLHGFDVYTVVLYDRAGLGWSDPGPWPRTAGRMAEELHRLLLAAEVPPPYVMVGHSLGGYVVRLYAARHPERLAGMVLVDSSHEDQVRRLPGRGRYIDEKKLRALRFQLKPLGAVRAAVALGVRREPRRSAVRWCPADLLEAYVACRLSTSFRRTGVQELLGFDPGAAEVRAEAGHLGHLPLIVVTAGTKDREYRGPQWYAAWREMQDELTQLSEHSAQVIAEHAGHHVHHDDPPLVVDAIRELVREARWR